MSKKLSECEKGYRRWLSPENNPKPKAGDHNAEPTKMVLGKRKLYRVTRGTKDWVWLKWNSFGHHKPGLSIRVSRRDFHRCWVMAAKRDGLDVDLYFRTTLAEQKELKRLFLDFLRELHA